MGTKAEELGVNLFPGYPVDALFVSGFAVRGVRTAPTGLSRDGSGPTYPPAMDLSAKVVVLAEGARCLLTQCRIAWQGVESVNPQTYSLGVKELWEVSAPPDRIVHTLGWPLLRDTFGGSWIYPMGEDLVSLGLVVELDSPHATLDVHGLLQKFKTHPFVRSIL